MKKILSFLIIGFAFLWGCSNQKKVVNKYYVIELQKEEDSTVVEHPLIDKYLEVPPVAVSAPYATNQIVNRSQSNEITYYVYHAWAVRPEDSFQKMMIRHFSQRSVFKDTNERFWKVTADYKLETNVYHIELISEKEDLIAHINLEFNVINNKSLETIITHKADIKKPLPQKDMNLFAASVSDIFHQELKTLTDKIISKLKTSTSDNLNNN